MLFISLVPHAQIEHDSRDESTFCDAQKEAGDKESGKTLSESHEGTNNTPCEGDGRKPEPRRCELEHEVTRDFEQDAADEEGGQCSEELVSG